uniref:Uncharacterized protein n=1 Tax=Nelumbo nucifera TaxID=4432 RepID=A0A822ZW06_NELNU|nr:TPA_asm: hypothetical protein HUJ06_017647 [Nelumbo nucifera]
MGLLTLVFCFVAGIAVLIALLGCFIFIKSKRRNDEQDRALSKDS